MRTEHLHGHNIIRFNDMTSFVVTQLSFVNLINSRGALMIAREVRSNVVQHSD